MLISNTIVSDLSTSKDRAKFLGYVSTAASMGFIIGPAVGGYWSDTFSKAAPVYAACCLYMLDLIIIVVLMNEPTSIKNDNDNTQIIREPFNYCDWRQIIHNLKQSSALVYMLVIQFLSSLVSKLLNENTRSIY